MYVVGVDAEHFRDLDSTSMPSISRMWSLRLMDAEHIMTMAYV